MEIINHVHATAIITSIIVSSLANSIHSDDTSSDIDQSLPAANSIAQLPPYQPNKGRDNALSSTSPASHDSSHDSRNASPGIII